MSIPSDFRTRILIENIQDLNDVEDIENLCTDGPSGNIEGSSGLGRQYKIVQIDARESGLDGIESRRWILDDLPTYFSNMKDLLPDSPNGKIDVEKLKDLKFKIKIMMDYHIGADSSRVTRFFKYLFHIVGPPLNKELVGEPVKNRYKLIKSYYALDSALEKSIKKFDEPKENKPLSQQIREFVQRMFTSEVNEDKGEVVEYAEGVQAQQYTDNEGMLVFQIIGTVVPVEEENTPLRRIGTFFDIATVKKEKEAPKQSDWYEINKDDE
jgi:hypothetical protein